MQELSEHFTLDEFVRSDTATARGIDNTPSAPIKANLLYTALLLEQVRLVLGHPIIITSGYRCPELNAAVGGVTHSAHQQGLAADIVCPAVGDPFEVARKILSLGNSIGFDQLIVEFGQWTHIGCPEPGEPARRQVLTIDSRGTRSGIDWSRN